MPVGAAGLAPCGIMSTPFGTTGVLEPGWLELPDMPGWLGSPNTSGWPEPTRYVDVAGYVMPIMMVGVAGFAAWGGPVGAVRQHASDGHYEPTVCSGVSAGFDTAGMSDGASGVARQIDPAWSECWESSGCEGPLAASFPRTRGCQPSHCSIPIS